jgi:hypothetical protein
LHPSRQPFLAIIFIICFSLFCLFVPVLIAVPWKQDICARQAKRSAQV